MGHLNHAVIRHDAERAADLGTHTGMIKHSEALEGGEGGTARLTFADAPPAAERDASRPAGGTTHRLPRGRRRAARGRSHGDYWAAAFTDRTRTGP